MHYACACPGLISRIENIDWLVCNIIIDDFDDSILVLLLEKIICICIVFILYI